LPYGEKSAQNIKNYSDKITEYLLQQDCKAIIIACNSASSHAYEHLKQQLPSNFILVNVIDPLVQYLAHQAIKKVGIIGTRATINANIYAQKINKKISDCNVESLATPLLAPYIEEGFFKKKEITQLVLKEYLEHSQFNDIEALVLACTHYPLIKAPTHQFVVSDLTPSFENTAKMFFGSNISLSQQIL